jgi:DTW domain-containing protein YfiP/GNAT superfamily N-acetyltransferase
MMTCTIKVLLSLLALGGQSSHHNNQKQVKQHDKEYAPHMRDKVASSIAKGERRAQERQAGRRELCDICHRPPIQCVCSSLPDQRIRTATRILVLQHPAEFRRKTFSTVPLLPLVLEHVQIQVGHSFEPDQVEPIRAAVARGQRPLLLFPGPDAISLDREEEDGEGSIISAEKLRESASIIDAENALKIQSQVDQTQLIEKMAVDDNSNQNLLVLIDGTWTQARRMAKNSPLLLEACQQVQFTADSVSLYDAIREEPEPHCLSTLETCAQALKLIEPNPEIAANATHHLHEALRSLVKVQLQHTSKQNDNNIDGTSVRQADPRFVSRADAAKRRKKRRLEVEREYFGTTAEYDSLSLEDETTTTSETAAPIHQEKEERPDDIRMDLGNGVMMRSLRVEDAQYLDEHWEKRSKNSLGMIRNQMQNYAAVCLGIECEQGTLCASILQYHNGALGMLFVDETMRRRGFGSALLREATRIVLEEQGSSNGEYSVVEAFIVDGNAASEALFQSQGWVRANPNEKRGTGKRRAPRKWIFVKES